MVTWKPSNRNVHKIERCIFISRPYQHLQLWTVELAVAADCVGREGDWNESNVGTNGSVGYGDTVHMDHHFRLLGGGHPPDA